jgi:hypothetical protein
MQCSRSLASPDSVFCPCRNLSFVHLKYFSHISRGSSKLLEDAMSCRFQIGDWLQHAYCECLGGEESLAVSKDLLLSLPFTAGQVRNYLIFLQRQLSSSERRQTRCINSHMDTLKVSFFPSLRLHPS